MRTAFAVLAFGLVVGSCSPAGTGADRSDPPMPVAAPAAPADQAEVAGRRFLVDHLEDGRIVRHDQGGDSVSEGQAYGMLIAAGIGDHDAFREIWTWTRDNLQRADGLLAWRWDDGAVVDAMPAADADLDAAHALAVAAERFGAPDLRAEAVRMAQAILDHEVVDGAHGPVLVAGPWAVDDRWVNPSYASPAAFAAISELSGDPAWAELDDAGRRVVGGSATQSDLPPDWAVLTPTAIEPRGNPGGGDVQHGYDAGRTSIRWAIDCDPAGRSLAAAMADEYAAASGDDGRPPAVLALDGSARADHGSPLMTVAHAAATSAAGDRSRTADLLDAATAQTSSRPTYYGDAWVVLARLWLTTDRLGGCAFDR